MNSSPSSQDADITFVCCVESGLLEFQVCRLGHSLGTHGGRAAAARFIAVTPRFGAPLGRETLQEFRRLGVEHVRHRPDAHYRRYAWNPYINKPLALQIAERMATTGTIVWLDSDILVADDLSALELPPGISFMACCSDSSGATSEPGDEMEPYWKELARIAQLSLTDLPWVDTYHDRKRVRYYFNSGMFAFRRGAGFADQYLANCCAILDERVSSKVTSFFYTDQVALGLTAQQLRLPGRALDCRYNYTIGFRTFDRWYSPEPFSQAAIIHYHDSMLMPFWPTFLKCLQEHHPRLGSWLAEQGVLSNKAGLAHRALSKALSLPRKRRWAEFAALARTF